MSFKGLVDSMLGTIIPCLGEADGVIYQHKLEHRSVGSPYKINAVFDEFFEFVDPDTEALVSSNQPRIGIRLRDLKDPPREADLHAPGAGVQGALALLPPDAVRRADGLRRGSRPIWGCATRWPSCPTPS